MTTLRMFRIRGKRFWFLVFAAIATFLIFRWGKDSEHVKQFGESQIRREDALDATFGKQRFETVKEDVKSAIQDVQTKFDKVKTKVQAVLQTPAPELPETTSSPAPIATIPPYLPDKRPPSDVNGIPESDEFLRPSNPKGRLEIPSISLTTTIHWSKQVEHFPVPTESIIHLPSGAPVEIPTIQFKFADETADAKISREKRQAQVKAEFGKAWKGYREKAWMHDEVSPVSGDYRDPFCGWAASLVDGMDTLFIMGFVPEFDEAVRAVGKMDFTTSVRDDIPMFETTIRYLGGLIAAYDVSGHKHKILLDKAVELADVMMGAFDTQNRMPDLYYRWKPAFASQKKMASYHANTAELGSMSMEFTRLAQLTKEHRYYDAVARITNALSEWQDRGTPLDGVFPDAIDASGCNRTMQPSLPMLPSKRPKGNSDAQPHGYQPLEEQRKVGMPKPGSSSDSNDSDEIEIKVLPGTPSKAIVSEKQGKLASPLDKREVPGGAASTRLDDTSITPEDEEEVPLTAPADLHLDSTTYGTHRTSEPECTPQGLEPSFPGTSSKFSMGGGQDSTYEYFPKQYLLLGGQEQKYGKMYLKTIEAVRKYMLYRPMIPGDKDILFSGMVSRVGVDGKLEPIYPEVEHLTCFIGGMVGMSAKIFDIDGDLEIAKKLTEGCVWAYSAFASGIMPEGSAVAICEDPKKCHWDEAAYRLLLDPLGEERNNEIDEYWENKKKANLANKEAARLAFDEAQRLADADQNTTTIADPLPPARPESDLARSDLAASKPAESSIGSAKLEKAEPLSLQKRSLEDDLAALQKPQTASIKPPSTPAKSEPRPNTDANVPNKKPTGSDGSSTPSVAKSDKPSRPSVPKGDAETDYLNREEEVATGRAAEVAQVPTNATATTEGDQQQEPNIPLTHKQYTDSKIEREGLPLGFTSIREHKYILRPEAIESVWYMYRITGDKSWQDKGWKMFEAIIAATSAPYGHSAIYDTSTPNPMQINEMESFWLAETLKYFYLLFSTPDVVSLDEWVLNTEAHPFRRPEFVGNENAPSAGGREANYKGT